MLEDRQRDHLQDLELSVQKRPKEVVFMLENGKLNGSVIGFLNIRKGKHQKVRGSSRFNNFKHRKTWVERHLKDHLVLYSCHGHTYHPLNLVVQGLKPPREFPTSLKKKKTLQNYTQI